MKTYHILVTGTVCLGLIGFASSVRADGFKLFKKDPVRVDKTTVKDVVTPDKDLSNLMTDLVTKRINGRRALLEKSIADELKKPDAVQKGRTFSEVTFRLGRPSFRYTSNASFEVNIEGNEMRAGWRTKGTDDRVPPEERRGPSREDKFNLRLTGKLSLPTANDPRFKASFNKGPADEWRGEYARRAAEHVTNNLTDSINSWLGAVNGPLQRLRQQGYEWFDVKLDQSRTVLEVYASKGNKIALKPVGRKK